MIPRLFAPIGFAVDTVIALEAATAHHAVRVLRLGVGATVNLFDGRGRTARASIAETTPCHVRIHAVQDAPPPPSPRLALAQCLSSADRMDWTIEKAVELGAARIAPLQSLRSVVRLDAQRAARRREHWQRVIVAACAQSGQNWLPRLDGLAPLPAWLAQAADANHADSLRLVLSPGSDRSLAAVLDDEATAVPETVWLLCGPESGFADEELAQARDSGWVAVGLGPRLLRTETAGLAALAVVQARWGDLR
jgi:16S rRNA (uracil1498-N3)-methyltransferase